jgi:hypothetical protein
VLLFSGTAAPDRTVFVERCTQRRRGRVTSVQPEFLTDRSGSNYGKRMPLAPLDA